MIHHFSLSLVIHDKSLISSVLWSISFPRLKLHLWHLSVELILKFSYRTDKCILIIILSGTFDLSPPNTCTIKTSHQQITLSTYRLRIREGLYTRLDVGTDDDRKRLRKWGPTNAWWESGTFVSPPQICYTFLVVLPALFILHVNYEHAKLGPKTSISLVNQTTYIYTTGQKFGKMLLKEVLYSPKLDLFDLNTLKTSFLFKITVMYINIGLF